MQRSEPISDCFRLLRLAGWKEKRIASSALAVCLQEQPRRTPRYPAELQCQVVEVPKASAKNGATLERLEDRPFHAFDTFEVALLVCLTIRSRALVHIRKIGHNSVWHWILRSGL